jgi:small-conductance mechanosensitive channel
MKMGPTIPAQLWLEALPLATTSLLILLAGWLVGRLLAAISWRLLHRLRFDEAAERSGLVDRLQAADISKLPSRLVGDVIHWIILLWAALIALDLLQLETVAVPLQALITFLPRLLAAGIILVAGLLLAQVISRAARAALVSLDVEVYEVGGRLVQGLVVIAAILVAVEQLGFDIGLLSTTFVGLITVSVGGLVLAFALGAQGIARAILAGYYIRENLRPGDRIQFRTWEGTLEGIGTIYSVFSVGEDRVLVPNQSLTEAEVRVRTGSGASAADSSE